MKWVYVGNIWGHEDESTKCPVCGSILIKRRGFDTLTFKSRCDKCGIKVPIGGREWIKSR